MSYWAANVNKSDEVVQQFQTLIQQQETQCPQPHFARANARGECPARGKAGRHHRPVQDFVGSYRISTGTGSVADNGDLPVLIQQGDPRRARRNPGKRFLAAWFHQHGEIRLNFAKGGPRSDGGL